MCTPASRRPTATPSYGPDTSEPTPEPTPAIATFSVEGPDIDFSSVVLGNDESMSLVGSYGGTGTSSPVTESPVTVSPTGSPLSIASILLAQRVELAKERAGLDNPLN